jgi:hypothetical protein
LETLGTRGAFGTDGVSFALADDDDDDDEDDAREDEDDEDAREAEDDVDARDGADEGGGGGGGVSLASILCRETMDGLGPGSERWRLLAAFCGEGEGRPTDVTESLGVDEKGLFRDGGDGG